MASMLELQSEHQRAAVVQGSSLHCSYAVYLSGTAYPVILGRLNHLSNYLISILGKLRHGIHGKQVKFSLGFSIIV